MKGMGKGGIKAESRSIRNSLVPKEARSSHNPRRARVSGAPLALSANVSCANVPLSYLEFLATLDALADWADTVTTGHYNGRSVGWLFGATIALIIAAFLTFLMRGTSTSVLVPIVFPLIILLCSRYFGLVAGILGSLLATSIFALFLFEPYGSFQVHNRQAMLNLGLMLFAGVALAYGNSEQGEPPANRKAKS